ncbi:MAG: DUF2065 domain-containing protein [Rhodospirillales bacterium]|jgi:uncharacterized protein YjeT (DUF2065 family)
MGDLLTALGLVLVIEGAVYALFPDAMKRITTQMLQVPSTSLRSAGLFAAVIGFGVVWLVRG